MPKLAPKESTTITPLVTTYYQQPGIELYLGDARDILPLIQLEIGIDAIVSDPPYGISFAHGGAKSGPNRNILTNPIVGDDEKFDPSPFLSFPYVCLWGANHYADLLPPTQRWLIWDKRGGTTPNDQADGEVAWTNSDKVLRILSRRWGGAVREGEYGTIQVHPTQKPVALMVWCMAQLEIPIGATVCDPFMGSATTALACMETGRKFIGIEIDPHYMQVSIDRIKDYAGNGTVNKILASVRRKTAKRQPRRQ